MNTGLGLFVRIGSAVLLLLAHAGFLYAEENSLEFPKDDLLFEEQSVWLNWSGKHWGAKIKGDIGNLTGIHYLNHAALLNPDDTLSVTKAENVSELTLDFNVSFWNWIKFFMQNSAAVSYLQQDDETNEENDRTINQCHLTFEFGEEITSFLSVGKMRVKWGTGVFWNPVDTINNNNLLSDITKEKEGKIAYRLDSATSVVSITGVWVPNSDDTDFKMDNFSRQSGHSLLAGRIYAYLWETDLSLYLSKKDLESLKTGISFSTVFSNWQIFGEAVQWTGEGEKTYLTKLSDRISGVDSISGLSYTIPASYSSTTKTGLHYKSLLGFQYTSASEITYIGELYYNHQGLTKDEMKTYLEYLQYLEQEYQGDLGSLQKVKAANPLFAVPDFYPRDYLLKAGNALFDFANLRQHYLHLSVKRSNLANRFDLGMDVVVNLDEYSEQNEMSFFARLSLAYTAVTNWLFTFYGQTFYGNDHSEFGMVYDNAALFGEIKYFF